MTSSECSENLIPNLSSESLTELGEQQLRRIWLAAKEEENYLDETKLKSFKPNRVQKKFLESKARVRALIAANKLGKTATGAKALLDFALQGGKVCRVIGSLGFEKGIRDIIIPEIKKWLPKSRLIKEKPNSAGITVKMYLKGDNGEDSIISFMSGEQDDMAFEGDIIDFAWIDEPIRRSVYTATLRGLIVSNGPLIMTLTPLTEPWIYNDIYSSTDPEIECFVGSIWDGAIKNGGHLTDEQINSFISKIPEDERGPRIYGEFKHLIGRIFAGFDPDIHVVEKFPIPMTWPVWCAIDPHTRKPHAAVWLAVSPDEIWYVINEVYWRAGIEEFGKHVKEISSQYNTVAHLIDTSAETQDWKRRDTARTLLSKIGLNVRLARKKNLKDTARMMIQQALEGKDESQEPWLYVFNTCKRTKFEFMNYVWDNYRSPDISGIKEEPRKINDDILDGLHYIVVEHPKYHKPEVLSRSGFEGGYGGSYEDDAR